MPYYTIEPLVKTMQARRQKDAAVATVERQASWRKSYDQITMPVRAQWDALELSLRELASLRAGDVIELPAGLMEQTQVLLNGAPKFIGTIGLDSDRVAVQLTRKIPAQPEEDSHGKSDGRKSA